MLSATEPADSLAAIGNILSWSFVASWYFIPLGMVHGLAVGLVAGLLYPLTLKISGHAGPIIAYSLISGGVLATIWFLESTAVFLASGFEFRTSDFFTAVLFGLGFALVSIVGARFVIYRPLFL